MVDGRTRLAAEVEAEVREHFGELVFATTVPRSVRLAEAPSHGLPAIAYDRRSRRRGGLLEGGDGACRALLSPAAAAASAAASRCWSAAATASPSSLHLPVEAIHPNPRQPRRRFEPEAGAGLADSIRARASRPAVVVRPRAAGGYELIAGERRWRAAREAGVATVPALVREADDRESLAARARRERRPRGALAGRGGARLRVAARRVRALARRGGRAGRQLEAVASRTGCGCSSFRKRCCGCSCAAS